MLHLNEEINKMLVKIVTVIVILQLVIFLTSGSVAFIKYVQTDLMSQNKDESVPLVETKIKVAADLNTGEHQSKDDNTINAERRYLLRKTAREIITCPVYVIPRFVPLPELPRDKLINATNEQEIIEILYDNIRDHQLYAEKQRQILFDSYDEYLNTCK